MGLSISRWTYYFTFTRLSTSIIICILVYFERFIPGFFLHVWIDFYRGAFYVFLFFRVSAFNRRSPTMPWTDNWGTISLSNGILKCVRRHDFIVDTPTTGEFIRFPYTYENLVDLWKTLKCVRSLREYFFFDCKKTKNEIRVLATRKRTTRSKDNKLTDPVVHLNHVDYKHGFLHFHQFLILWPCRLLVSKRNSGSRILKLWSPSIVLSFELIVLFPKR